MDELIGYFESMTFLPRCALALACCLNMCGARALLGHRHPGIHRTVPKPDHNRVPWCEIPTTGGLLSTGGRSAQTPRPKA